MPGLAVQGVGTGLVGMGTQYGVTERQIMASFKHGMI
jgi:hypothetical protein